MRKQASKETTTSRYIYIWKSYKRSEEGGRVVTLMLWRKRRWSTTVNRVREKSLFQMERHLKDWQFCASPITLRSFILIMYKLLLHCTAERKMKGLIDVVEDQSSNCRVQHVSSPVTTFSESIFPLWSLLYNFDVQLLPYTALSIRPQRYQMQRANHPVLTLS